MIILFTVMLLVLLAIGLPVGFALGSGGLVGMLLFNLFRERLLSRFWVVSI